VISAQPADMLHRLGGSQVGQGLEIAQVYLKSQQVKLMSKAAYDD